jgi:hypothetical protein
VKREIVPKMEQSGITLRNSSIRCVSIIAQQTQHKNGTRKPSAPVRSIPARCGRCRLRTQSHSSRKRRWLRLRRILRNTRVLGRRIDPALRPANSQIIHRCDGLLVDKFICNRRRAALERFCLTSPIPITSTRLRPARVGELTSRILEDHGEEFRNAALVHF